MGKNKREKEEGLPKRSPMGTRSRSVLVDENLEMAKEQRQAVQDGHRKRFGVKVHANERPNQEQPAAAPTEDFQNGLAQHPDPMFNSQRFDGTDSTLNPAPDLNTEARLKYDNERRDQEQEKQERLENVLGLNKKPKFSPRPGGP
jgi:hypothetical protein